MEPVFIDTAVMKSIDLHLKVKSEDVTSMIANFLHTFFTSSSFMETHEMDNFVLKNELVLSKWYDATLLFAGSLHNPPSAWQFYDVQQPEIAKLRTSVLLRVLSVGPEEFQRLVEQGLSHDQEWERR